MITAFIKKLTNRKATQKNKSEDPHPHCRSNTADLGSEKPVEIGVFKLKKSDYSSLSKFLLRVGVVEGNQARPDQVFVSSADMRKFRAALSEAGRKQGLHGKQLEMAVGMEMLNLSPNGQLEGVLKEGFAVVIK